MVLAALFTALTAVFAQLIIPIGAVPLSMAIIAVFVSGAILDPRSAFYSQLTYLFIGITGIPVFSGFSGGLTKLIGPTGGFLFSYPLMAFLVAVIVKKWGKRSICSFAIGMSAALLGCYLCGTAWYMLVMESAVVPALSACVFPFIGFDVIKILMSTVFASLIEKALAKAQLYKAI